MNLLPIEEKPQDSAAAGVYIKCAGNCGNYPYGIAWNEASIKRWTWDQQGKAYQAYYCEHCSKEKHL